VSFSAIENFDSEEDDCFMLAAFNKEDEDEEDEEEEDEEDEEERDEEDEDENDFFEDNG
jgi:hypothetical protein